MIKYFSVSKIGFHTLCFTEDRKLRIVIRRSLNLIRDFRYRLLNGNVLLEHIILNRFKGWFVRIILVPNIYSDTSMHTGWNILKDLNYPSTYFKYPFILYSQIRYTGVLFSDIAIALVKCNGSINKLFTLSVLDNPFHIIFVKSSCLLYGIMSCFALPVLALY